MLTLYKQSHTSLYWSMLRWVIYAHICTKKGPKQAWGNSTQVNFLHLLFKSQQGWSILKQKRQVYSAHCGIPFKEGVEEEAVVIWSKFHFPLILVTFIWLQFIFINWWYYIIADLPMNPQVQWDLCSSCQWFLSNSVETKVLHKTTPISRTTIKISCFKCMYCIFH